MKLIDIKYCGGCNPHIDRTMLVQKISILLPSEYIFTTKKSSPWDIGILVCGCPTACADKPEFNNLACKWIVAAGKSLDCDNMPESRTDNKSPSNVKSNTGRLDPLNTRTS